MKNIILLLLFGVANTVFSQTITVKDLDTNKPLELVTLISKNPKSYIITNVKGQADISAFKETEKIEIRILGYRAVVKSYSELESDNFEVLLEMSNLNLDEIVISGTRWNQTSDDVPSKVISISSKDVALQNIQTAADLLSVSGKVYVQKSQQGGGSPMIRGFATNRLLYVVDGIRMNTAIYRSGNLQNIISLDPFATENTEVLFGPGSVIYGSDAIGGVMSFQTLTPQLSISDDLLISGKAITRYSSANNEKTAHFDVNIGWEKWASITSFSAWDFDHLKQGSNGPDDYLKSYYVTRQSDVDNIITQDDPLLQIPSAYSQMNVMQKILFKPNEKLNFQYGFHYSETSPYGRYDRHNRIREGTARYAEWNYGPQKWMMNNLKIVHDDDNVVYDQVILNLTFQSFEESRIDRSLNKNERSTNTEQVEAYSVNLDFKKSTGVKNTLYYGAEYVLNDVNSVGQVTDISTGENEIAPSRYPNANWSSIAVYLNDALKASDKLTLQAGLRYNQFNLDADFTGSLDFYPFPFKKANINNGALTGSIGGVYRPSEKWVISTNFGTAFRSPNVDDVGKVFDSEPGAVTVPNPDLDAEYAYNFDLGIAKVFGDFIKIDMTGYYTILRNALVRRNFQLNGQSSILYDGEMSQVQAIQNAAKANVYGVQVGLEVKLPAGFSISSDLNYQIGEEELDDGKTGASRHSAPLFGISRLNFKAESLSLQFYTAYQGERKFEDLAVSEQGKDEIYAKDTNGNNYSPSWHTLNIKTMYDLTETFTVNAGIENLTDQRYRQYSSGISAPGRNFILSLRANF
ncbi:hemoglobin/transferrin/lactoferrin receptor protein [Aquimarina sp. MAR_2010_214]|uniref:TonB-dependent receptor plug domain-containing protein n=1 Tax=Aquimarina sp. MAR_2010_214 TaxID=1250026 RepID=UPI000C70DD46|nr:TonB-dependent receptor [Aquimarina sp. MAR_2010_214]PKV50671.1 hemoglobin/transferrin/lactoferrin receptor protein [Aquimarina sp. MAR_2010_214]